MSANRPGCLTRHAKEWGSKARKEEERLRNLSDTAEREVIAEQLAEMNESLLSIEEWEDLDDGPEALTWYIEPGDRYVGWDQV